MRQALAKATRRDLRRAVGPHAVDTVQALDASIASLKLQHAVLQEVTGGLKRNADTTLNYIGAVHGELLAFQRMSRWQRVKWVLGF